MKLLATLLIAGTALLAQRAGGGARMASRPSGGNAGFHRVSPAPPIRIVPPVRTIIAPYPAFYGGYYYGPYTGYDTAPPPPAYGYGYNDPNYNNGDPNAPQNYAYDPNQAPPVLINRNYQPDSINPVIRNYSGEPLQDPQANAGINDTPQIVFLIAMKDHTIFPAVAYWVEDNTLNYITTQGVHNSASLDNVDRDFSKLLNSQRQVDFALPPAAK
jgi:hypothetical protein